MKKFLYIIITVCFFTLSSCSLFGEKEHDHAFGNQWLYTGGEHYKVCQVDGCNEKSEKGNHEFENGKCKVCGYRQPSLN